MRMDSMQPLFTCIGVDQLEDKRPTRYNARASGQKISEIHKLKLVFVVVVNAKNNNEEKIHFTQKVIAQFFRNYSIFSMNDNNNSRILRKYVCEFRVLHLLVYDAHSDR